MFDRSACAKIHLEAEPHIDLSALAVLAALLRNILNEGSAALEAVVSSVSPLSGDRNRREAHLDLGPAKCGQPIAHRILQRATLPVVQNLMCRRLADVKDRFALQVMGPDLVSDRTAANRPVRRERAGDRHRTNVVHGARGLSLCSQQPGLAATHRDVPRRRHRPDRSGDGLRAPSRQRSASARSQGSLNEYELDHAKPEQTAVGAPQRLPLETQATLTSLMTRLILDHADKRGLHRWGTVM
jgi:hypothetical protein